MNHRRAAWLLSSVLSVVTGEASAACEWNYKTYPDHRTACAALLQSQSPPETVLIADLHPDGDVHCAGKPAAEGLTGFDQRNSGIKCTAVSAGPSASSPAAASPAPPACPQQAKRNRTGEQVIESELGPATSRAGFERQLFTGVQVGLPGWERAHSQGAGTGTESAQAIYYAPAEVNQAWMNQQIERFLRDLRSVKPADERLCLKTVTTAHPGTLRLSEIQYEVTALKAGHPSKKVLVASLSVENKRSKPRVTPKVTLLNLGPR